MGKNRKKSTDKDMSKNRKQGKPRLKKLFRQFCREHGMPNADSWWDAYCNFPKEELFDYFFNRFEQRKKDVESEADSLEIILKNGRVGEEYQCDFTLPSVITSCEFTGLDDFGLSISTKTEKVPGEANHLSCCITGIPTQTGDVNLVMNYTFDFCGKPNKAAPRTLGLTVNPDPKTLWNSIPTDKNIEYYQEDQDCLLIPGNPENGTRTMLAASQRGRSHAHHGTPRDDNFRMAHDPDSGWHVMAVADGAGSAPCSRKGSQLACEIGVNKCLELVRSMGAPDEEAFSRLEQDRKNPELLHAIRKIAYNILAKSAHAATMAIREEARAKERNAREYATTLQMVLCRRLAESWVVLSFGIGDGAMAVLSREGDALALHPLGKPDEGQFSGQTCFITMSSVYADSRELFQRIYAYVLDDFEAILLMTDGVSDAKFETSAQMQNVETWQELWKELAPFAANNDRGGLLEWLSFWSTGNHDDRTIAIMY